MKVDSVIAGTAGDVGGGGPGTRPRRTDGVPPLAPAAHLRIRDTSDRQQSYSRAMLDLGVDLDVWPWVWLFVAMVFTLTEVTVLGGSFILLPFGLSAFFAAILGFYDAPIEAQWAMFVGGGAVFWVAFYRWARRFLVSELPPGVGADRLVGMTATVTVAVSPADTARGGRISVDGEIWGAISGADCDLSEGTRVRITAMQGTRVVVEPLDADGREAGGEPQ